MVEYLLMRTNALFVRGIIPRNAGRGIKMEILKETLQVKKKEGGFTKIVGV